MALLQLYPKARENRLHGRDPSTRAPRHGFLKAAGMNFLMLQVLFLALFAYIFGSLFQQSQHTHNLNIVFVDYDGGIVGSAFRNSYQKLKGDSFPSIREETPSKFPRPENLREEVCSARSWAAVYTSPGASDRLEKALSGGSEAANYNRSDALFFIWNEARYSAIVDTAIAGNLQALAAAARLQYTASNGTGAMESLNSTDPASISVFADPWTLTSLNIQPTTQGSRLIYNTLVIILILIQEFFYLGTINGLYMQFKLYSRFYPHRIIAFRNMNSAAYTLIGSLCVTGMIWAFRAGWDVNGNQFALTWAILWLFAHLNFLWLDVFTIWFPVQYVPMALITWVIFNVTSILVPFELSPGFYRWAYAMPAHEVYQVLTDVWSGGCNPQLYYALPIMFVEEILGFLLSALGVYRRCHYATLADEAQEKAAQGRLDAAMEFERQRERERRETREGSGDLALEPKQTEEERETEREELGEVIRRENTKIRRERRESRACNFGPSFDLAFNGESSDTL